MPVRLAAIAFALSLTNAFAAAHPRVPVTVLQNIPTTVSYDADAKQTSVTCSETTCTPYYMPKGTGTLDLRGAHLQLLLPTGQVVVAECFLKDEKAQYLLEAIAGGAASPSYRNCIVPRPNSTVEAQVEGTKVKLFIRTPTAAGSVAQLTETYQLKTILPPAQLIGQLAAQ